MEILKLENLNCSNCTERSMRIHYPEFANYLAEHYPEDLTWAERLYWYYNNINSRPGCKMCGGRTEFMSLKRGYREFCCYKCSYSCPEVQDRKKQTSLRKYGVANAMQSEAIKTKLKQTNIERFGVENPFANEDVKKKIVETNRLKYGVDYHMQSTELRKKSKQTCLDRYGVEYTSQIESVRMHKKSIAQETNEKGARTFKKNYLQSHPNIIDYDDVNYICKCPHENCSICEEKIFVIPKQIYHSRRPQCIELCTNLLPIDNSIKDTHIELFIQSILDEYGIEYQTNIRSIIAPKELDIYIPSKNIAIECNGAYWHSNIYKDHKYHYQKFEDCAAKGIQLLSIWEDWVFNKRDIVKSILLSKLGIYEYRIYARQCDIREVSVKESNHFLEKNHIQGKCPSQKRLGLYYNDKLISLMSFGSKRSSIMGNHKNANNTYELLRFCNECGYQVVGGASRLLKHFIDEYDPCIIESFSSNDISNGDLYRKLGFEKGLTNQSYWYIEGNSYRRYHRSSFTKDSIVKRGWKDSKSGWTETEAMTERGYYQIYDSGQTKWVLDLKK